METEAKEVNLEVQRGTQTPKESNEDNGDRLRGWEASECTRWYPALDFWETPCTGTTQTPFYLITWMKFLSLPIKSLN